MSLKRHNKKSTAAVIVSLTNEDLREPFILKDQAQHGILYMIPITNYQYELNGEKVLSQEHELPYSDNSSHYISRTTQPYQPTKSTTNLDDRYVVTPELTISSENSMQHKVGNTLVDNAVQPLDLKNNKKLSSLLILKLKTIFLFTKKQY